MKQLQDIARLLVDDFTKAAKLAGLSVAANEISVEVLPAPHTPPTRLPKGKMAVYAFMLGGECLKVGKVGARSTARYVSQHYLPRSSRSNLARSLLDAGDGDRALVGEVRCTVQIQIDHLDNVCILRWHRIR